MLLTSLQVFCGLEGWPGWKILNRKYSRASIFNAGGKTLMSLAQTVKFLGARIEDVLNICLWNLVYSIFDPGQRDLSKC